MKQVKYYNTSKLATRKQKSYLISLYKSRHMDFDNDLIEMLTRQEASLIINSLKED